MKLTGKLCSQRRCNRRRLESPNVRCPADTERAEQFLDWAVGYHDQLLPIDLHRRVQISQSERKQQSRRMVRGMQQQHVTLPDRDADFPHAIGNYIAMAKLHPQRKQQSDLLTASRPQAGGAGVTFAPAQFGPVRNAASSVFPGAEIADNAIEHHGSWNLHATMLIVQAAARIVRAAWAGANWLASEMLIWQLADSAFPSGGFAHSAGLEACWQQGLVHADSLPAWIETQTAQIAHGALPFVLAAHRTPQNFLSIDSDCDAFLNNHVANRASRLQGQAWGDTAARTLAGAELGKFRETARASAMHLPVVFGVVCRLVDFSIEQTARLYLFIALRGWISAAVRLGIVGPMEGQTIQARLLTRAGMWALAALEWSCDDAAQTAPISDMLLAGHDRLYSRLFQS